LQYLRSNPKRHDIVEQKHLRTVQIDSEEAAERVFLTTLRLICAWLYQNNCRKQIRQFQLQVLNCEDVLANFYTANLCKLEMSEALWKHL
jgi:hypothetical protein